MTNTATYLSDYAALKLAHDDDIVLYQAGDFYEIYGYEAKVAAETLDLTYTMRMVPGLGQVYMCGFPVSALENNLALLREKADVIVSGISTQTGERVLVSFPSIDHEAEQALNAREAEFGADGTRAFRDPAAQQETPPAPPKREITQEDIDRAIQAWNGNLQSKHAVVRHMEMYARDRKTAEAGTNRRISGRTGCSRRDCFRECCTGTRFQNKHRDVFIRLRRPEAGPRR